MYGRRARWQRDSRSPVLSNGLAAASVDGAVAKNYNFRPCRSRTLKPLGMVGLAIPFRDRLLARGHFSTLGGARHHAPPQGALTPALRLLRGATMTSERQPRVNSGFGGPRRGSALRVALYARVSTHDQQTLSLQMTAMKAYAAHRGWRIALRVEDVGSRASERPRRDGILEAARRREIDAILVWRLDRWGRSLTDLVVTLRDLAALDVGFVSLTETLDLTTPTGRAMAGMLAVFAAFEREILRERVKAGLEQARRKGRQLGRPPSAALLEPKVRKLFAQKISQAEIARRLSIGRTSVRRILHALRRPAA